jgi:hypothetical protein
MKKTVLRFGLYGAITICILFLLGWFVGKNLGYSAQEIIGYASMIVSLGFVYLGIKHFRDKENSGQVSFKKALTIGVMISLITALAFGIIDIIYIEFLNPDFTADYYAHIVEDLKVTLPEEELGARLAEIEAEKEMFSNPLLSFLLMALTVFIIGFIISLISSLVLQRKN